MKRSKILKRVLIGLILLVSILSISIYFYLQSFKPQYEGELTLKGLNKDVEVYFDDYGIPHIYAQNEEDAYYALGYVHAQERLFQMEMLRRVGSGRLAEALGEDLIEVDQFFRTIGLPQHAKESAKKYLSERKEPYQKAALAYLDGVNEYVKNGKTPLEYTLIGLEKEAFTPEDMYSIMGYMAYTFNVALTTDPIFTKIHNKLGEKYMKDLAINWKEGTATIPVYPKMNPQENDSIPDKELISQTTNRIFGKLPIPIWIGSNSWVVSGEKTKSGKVFFANDTHIGFGQPAVWFEAHLEYPDFSFYGNHIAGLPFAPIGHTREHAWGITMLQNDDTDFYQEKFNPENPNQVKFKDTWEEVEIRSETIQVKDKEPITFDVKTTRHGPIINDCVADLKKVTEEPISMFMTYTKFPVKALQAFYNFGKAENPQEFGEACSLIHAPGFNLMYGDAKGNIAWFATARLMKRPEHLNPKFIRNGYNGKDEILGWYDFSENPKAINPPSNYVYSANNQPDSTNGILHQGYYVPEHRAKRIMFLLNQENQWDMDKMQGMILDNISVNFPEVVKEIVTVIEKQKPAFNQNQQQTLELLKSWNGEHTLESIAPTVYYKLIYHILAEAMQDEVGEEDFQSILNKFLIKRSIPFLIKNDSSLWWDNVSTETKETRQDIFTKALEKTVIELENQLGDNPKDWEWQKVHTITHEHPFGKQGGWLAWFFNVGPIPIDGGDDVINNVAFHMNEEGKYPSLHGPAMRILIDFADVENSISVLPSGQSGRVMSKHYDDQAQMYADGEFRKQMMNETEIKEKGRKLVLKAE